LSRGALRRTALAHNEAFAVAGALAEALVADNGKVTAETDYPHGHAQVCYTLS
jgi:hypothetical protein